MKKISGMVDITQKRITNRVARAVADVILSKKAFEALMSDSAPKGNVFEVARIAGIMSAKNVHNLIPHCHQLTINKASIDFRVDKEKRILNIFSEVICDGKTGVEMEALTSVGIAALTVYDMLKSFDKGTIISGIKLIYKEGGKSGVYKRK
ncbi:MAG: cyclic pyranopterin monophosphate synthase MoaC [Candidatus Omnitrophica bacterium]|nr:cyclic pyranopterin monophosphate synthase MoaC [Candidatus Omnitrophota bacterium]